jgi:hypothetical protein
MSNSFSQLQIDGLRPGAIVALKFHKDPEASMFPEPYYEGAIFHGIDGEGDERRARFRSSNEAGIWFEWEAYIHEGHWAYGSGADLLEVAS